MTVLARPVATEAGFNALYLAVVARRGHILRAVRVWLYTPVPHTLMYTPLPDKADCCYRYSIALGNLPAWVAQVVPFTDFQYHISIEHAKHLLLTVSKALIQAAVTARQPCATPGLCLRVEEIKLYICLKNASLYI